MAVTIASAIARKPRLNAFSVSVSVSASEFLNIASIRTAVSAAMSGRFTPIMKKPALSAKTGAIFLTASLR